MTTPRQTARGIVIDDSKILLMERWRDGLHYFSIPGGGVEDDETAEAAVIREIAEETTCVVTIKRKLYIMVHQSQQHHIYLCNFVTGVPKLQTDAPEARMADSNNRFEPGWMSLSALSADQFLIWKPVFERLRSDLADGFSSNVVEIISQDKP